MWDAIVFIYGGIFAALIGAIGGIFRLLGVAFLAIGDWIGDAAERILLWSDNPGRN